MARDGAGTYSLPAGNPVVSGATINSTTHNTTMTDIATALTASIAKDGQTVPTADLPMGGYSHTNVDDAATRTEYAQAAQVQDSSITYLTSTAGTNTITASAPLSMSAYAAGQMFHFIPAATNTGATTININSIGAKNIYAGGGACVGGELRISVPAIIVYDGTQFNLIGFARGGLDFINRYTASGDATFDIETGIDSTKYNGYMISVEYLYPTTNAQTISMRLKTASAYASASYSTIMNFIATGSPTTLDGSGVATGSFGLVNASTGSSTAANAWAGNIWLPNAHTTIGNLRAHGFGAYVGSGGNHATVFFGGVLAATTTLEGIRFLSSSGNITGAVCLFGIRKS